MPFGEPAAIRAAGGIVESYGAPMFPGAMFLLAQYYDPASTLPRGSIQPDVSQAVQWYKKAAQNGIAEADAALKALKAQLEQKAASGDAEAKRLLQNF